MRAQLGQRERRCWLRKAREMKTGFDYSLLYKQEGNWTQLTFEKTSGTVIRDRGKNLSIAVSRTNPVKAFNGTCVRLTSITFPVIWSSVLISVTREWSISFS